MLFGAGSTATIVTHVGVLLVVLLILATMHHTSHTAASKRKAAKRRRRTFQQVTPQVLPPEETSSNYAEGQNIFCSDLDSPLLRSSNAVTARTEEVSLSAQSCRRNGSIGSWSSDSGSSDGNVSDDGGPQSLAAYIHGAGTCAINDTSYDPWRQISEDIRGAQLDEDEISRSNHGLRSQPSSRHGSASSQDQRRSAFGDAGDGSEEKILPGEWL